MDKQKIKVIIRKSRAAKLVGLGVFAYLFYRLGYTDCIMKVLMTSLEEEETNEQEDTNKSA